ncbi:uncharacterized protein LOC18442601 [Amborella trichopoda]|nr:uncharacterized protein LOC18442601 [Amborella trichopoda]|eukprot:XP_020528052.1 uncharacterized protein LOC18442601 [Amborella trichopoda]
MDNSSLHYSCSGKDKIYSGYFGFDTTEIILSLLVILVLLSLLVIWRLWEMHRNLDDFRRDLGNVRNVYSPCDPNPCKSHSNQQNPIHGSKASHGVLMKNSVIKKMGRYNSRISCNLHEPDGQKCKFSLSSTTNNGVKWGELDEDGKNKDIGSIERELETELESYESCEEGEDEFFETNLERVMRLGREFRKAACLELEKERKASASAANEAMGMILRLQTEKSMVEMQARQYQRVAEQKQIYDQEVIRSLREIIAKQDAERDFLEGQLKMYSVKLFNRSFNGFSCKYMEERGAETELSPLDDQLKMYSENLFNRSFNEELMEEKGEETLRISTLDPHNSFVLDDGREAELGSGLIPENGLNDTAKSMLV